MKFLMYLNKLNTQHVKNTTHNILCILFVFGKEKYLQVDIILYYIYFSAVMINGSLNKCFSIFIY